MNKKRQYQKTVEALAYLTNKDTRLYWILKMLWYAERCHLSRYAMPIVGDTYIAMSHGPVPSLAYDIAKSARGGNFQSFKNPNPLEVFEAPNNKTLIPKRSANTSMLSATDIECLDEAFNELHNKSFDQVKKLSHTSAYEQAEQDDVIPFDKFVAELENGKEVFDYLTSL